ncbi:Mss4-like protein [Mycena amicta]|nr:Mss4-like protein [Mycena amicta]
MSGDEAPAVLGNCHCGSFQFSVKFTSMASCDCGLCSRNACLWTRPSELKILKGEITLLRSYRNGRKLHKFCPKCGTSLLCCDAEESSSVAVNVRALTNFELNKLPVVSSPCCEDVSPEALDTATVHILEDGNAQYRGHCHCAGVSYTLQIPPIERTKSCNCSICSRNGVLWIYPPVSAVTILSDASIVDYTFGPKQVVHGFCATCAVPMWERFLNPAKAASIGINVRAIDGLNFRDLPSRVHNGAATPPQYQLL